MIVPVLKDFYFTPDLRTNYEDDRAGYPSFRRFVEDRLSTANLADIKKRLEKLDSVFSQYRDSDVIVQNPEGKRLKRWNVTTLRDQIMRVISLMDTHESTSLRSIQDREEPIKKGKIAVHWLKAMGLEFEKPQEVLRQLEGILALNKAMRDGQYAHLVAGPQGAAMAVPPTIAESSKGRGRWKLEKDTKYVSLVKGLVAMLRGLSGKTSMGKVGPAELEAGELLYATGVAAKGKNPAGYVHKIIRSS